MKKKNLGSLQVLPNRLKWNVNKVITPTTLNKSLEERKQLVDYALEGIDSYKHV